MERAGVARYVIEEEEANNAQTAFSKARAGDNAPNPTVRLGRSRNNITACNFVEIAPCSFAKKHKSRNPNHGVSPAKGAASFTIDLATLGPLGVVWPSVSDRLIF